MTACAMQGGLSMNRFFAAGRWIGFEDEGEDGAALISPDCAVAPNTPLKQLIAMVEATEKIS